jgi:hypothetical protein
MNYREIAAHAILTLIAVACGFVMGYLPSYLAHKEALAQYEVMKMQTYLSMPKKK